MWQRQKTQAVLHGGGSEKVGAVVTCGRENAGRFGSGKGVASQYRNAGGNEVASCDADGSVENSQGKGGVSYHAALAELKAQSPGAVDRIAANEAEIAELRENMNRLKTEVRRKHHQRNELRRELREVQKAEKEGEHEEVMKQRDHEAAEKALLEPEFEEGEATARGYLAPRIPVFPLNFLDKADSFPNHVIPAALNLVGRLASGDAAAFSGVRMLKATDGLLRVRFSGCFRLIFRVNDHEIEVVDVIDRKDLNRWLLRR